MATNTTKKRTRLKDIAEHAQVSVSLVSRVLNNNMGNTSASSEVIERIRQSADTLGYVPDIIARSLKTGKTHTIAVVMTIASDFSTSLYTKLLLGIMEGGKNTDYHFLYQYFSNEEEELFALKKLKQLKVDGILYAPYPGFSLMREEKYQAIAEVMELGAKIVFCMENYKMPNTYYFKVDNYSGGRIAAEYIISKGKKEIACFYSLMEDRLKGFIDHLKDNGLRATIIESAGFTFEEGYHLAMKCLEKGELPGGIFTFSDYLAQGVCQAIVDYGLDLGDYCVIGHDGLDVIKYFHYKLPSVKQPVEEVGRQSVKALINIIEDKKISSCAFLPELITHF